MSDYRVKICGVTNLPDAQIAEEAGADYIGVLVEVATSPRSVSPETAAEITSHLSVPGVLLLMHPSLERAKALVDVVAPDAVQLLGPDTGEDVLALRQALGIPVWKSLHLPPRGEHSTSSAEALARAAREYAEAGAELIVLDTKAVVGEETLYGGTGRVHDWTVARELVMHSPLPVLLAGGIGPNNVRQALRTVRPFGVDLSSRVELAVGKKDPTLLHTLFAAVRQGE